MENLHLKIEHCIINRHKEQAVKLKEFYALRNLRGTGAAMAFSVDLGDKISEITRRNQGFVVIKKENITPGDLLILYIDGDYHAVNVYAVDDFQISINAWNISKKQAYCMLDKKESVL